MKNQIKNFFKYKPESIDRFILHENKHEKEIAEGKIEAEDNAADSFYLSVRLKDNLEAIKYVYSYPQNSDIVIKEFKVGQDKKKDAFIVYIDGMCNVSTLNEHIIKPIFAIESSERDLSVKNISEKYLVQAQANIAETLSEVVEIVNFGGVAFFIEGDKKVLCADIRMYGHRGIEKPTAEPSVMGPQESFNELLRNNTALIRQRIRDDDLVIEGFTVGRRSNTSCSFLYIKNIANKELVKEVRRRVKNIDTDMLNDAGELEQFIEDSTFNPFPQVMKTERPDIAAAKLVEGRVVILVNGTPNAIIVPVEASEFLETSEDQYLRFPYVELMKVLRLICVFLALTLPGIYIAILNFHQEMIPTTLLYAIEASREQVPFSTLVELMMMELVFDILSEASIRTPKPIGATFGIVGALALGQAAVVAKIVSPIMIIIIAICGLGTFVIPNYAFSFSMRVMKYVFIFAAAMAGMLGITTMLFVVITLMISTKSFGIPLLTSSSASKNTGIFYRLPIWQQEHRHDYLNSQDMIRQPKYSRLWRKSNNGK